MNIKKVLDRKKTALLITVLFSVVFGFCYALTQYLAKNSTESVKWYLFPLGVVIFMCAFIALIYIVTWYKGKSVCQARTHSQYPLFYIICFIANVLIGILYMLVYYPGTGNYDTIAIMKNGFGMANQHPILYITFVLCLKKIVFLFGGGYEVLYLVNSIITIVIMSLVFTYIIHFLGKRKVPFPILTVIALFYTLCPIFNLYKVTFLKDVPFSLLLLMWVPVLYDTWETKGENLKKIGTCLQCFLFLCLSLMRGNGIYISVIVLLCMLVSARKQWKQLLLFFLVLILAFGGISSCEKHLGIQHLFKESAGIPLQQIAATIYNDGKITEEQAEFIDQVLPIEFIKEKYNPYSAVPLKWGGAPLDNEFLYAHKMEFIKVWAQMLVPNFKIYVKSYLQATYGFWSLGPALGSYRYTSLYEAAYDEWITNNNIRIKSFFSENTQNILESIGNKIIRVPGEGICFWIMILLLLVLMYFDGWKIVLIGVPMLAGSLTVFISTPIAYSWRYILFIPFFIPVLAGLLLRQTNKEA